MEAKHHLLKDSWLLLGNFESFPLNSSHFEVENKVSGTYDCKEPSKLFKTYIVLNKNTGGSMPSFGFRKKFEKST